MRGYDVSCRMVDDSIVYPSSMHMFSYASLAQYPSAVMLEFFLKLEQDALGLLKDSGPRRSLNPALSRSREESQPHPTSGGLRNLATPQVENRTMTDKLSLPRGLRLVSTSSERGGWNADVASCIAASRVCCIGTRADLF
ncbi:hypothetical protein M407DRAFT_163497 [Tulasnella calospora MUT 4182]|uniref:Uncharacterized protein n=1 Tax=Tulasnella calospora MUT 4182 TaxID=1051891 RepID=A0A0C3QQC9_9AGAM|nr:hypothetical protein M407DRAFT_163497 [Tulasnella calospora MUT 4182]